MSNLVIPNFGALLGEFIGQVPAGTMLFEEGAPCSGLPFVLAGTVRVARNASSGRSLRPGAALHQWRLPQRSGAVAPYSADSQPAPEW